LKSDKPPSLGLRVAKATFEAAIQGHVISDFSHFEFINDLMLLNKAESSRLDEIREGTIVVYSKTPEFLIDRIV